MVVRKIISLTIKKVFKSEGINTGEKLEYPYTALKEAVINALIQFFETAIQTGIVGLTILLLVFAIPLYQSIKKKQELRNIGFFVIIL